MAAEVGEESRSLTLGDSPKAQPRWVRPLVWTIALIGLFGILHLSLGSASNLFSEDYTQVFLLGLGYYATGVWPYFGPDVTWTSSEIPGALQSLLVGVPFHIAPVPEAPLRPAQRPVDGVPVPVRVVPLRATA